MAAESPLNRRPFKNKPRPASWFRASGSMSAALAAAKNPLAAGRREPENPFLFHHPSPPPKTLAVAAGGKHKLSPSPSPRHRDYDFELSSPCPPAAAVTPLRNSRSSQTGSSSPIPDSPTGRYMAANTAAKLRIVDDDSPIRTVPGHSRSLAAARSVQNRDDLFSPKPRSGSPRRSSASSSFMFVDAPDDPPTPLRAQGPPPLFPIRTSQSQDCSTQWKVPRCSGTSSRIPRMSASHPLRSRASTGDRGLALAQKKAISMGDMQADRLDDSTFGSAFLHGRKARSSLGVVGGFSGRPRRSGGLLGASTGPSSTTEQSLSRSVGHKSGLSLSLSGGLRPMPDFSTSNSSIASSVSSQASVTPPLSADFEHVKPNQQAFEPASFGVKSKFKRRDSGDSANTPLHSSTNDDRLMPPPSILRPSTGMPISGPSVKRARSLGHRHSIQTPVDPPTELASKFDFVCQGVSSFGFGGAAHGPDDKPSMPGTPVKRSSFSKSRRVVTSISQPVLGSDHLPPDLYSGPSSQAPPGSTRKSAAVPHLTFTTTSSPDSVTDGGEPNSPSIRLGSAAKAKTTPSNRNLDLLRCAATGSSSVDCSEDDATPTKGRGERHILACELSSLDPSLRTANNTPSPSPHKSTSMLVTCSMPSDGLVPRLSLPAFGNTAKGRRVRHRQSHPVAPPVLPEEEDIFESRFVVKDSLGKGAFSTVLLVQERHGEGIFAVKKTRNVFDGVKDRLRHLEEVDVLRHLSTTQNSHVIKFNDAWEQNRQLYIQTEACVGSLAQFLEVYGHDNLRLDEGRVWKMARDVSDGLLHIHSHGVIHFDIKTANILVAQDRSLKIADFGLATRWPRIAPEEIIAGSGLGGSIGTWSEPQKLEREGDRVYMPPEMLRGVFVMAADIYSFGIVFLELALNVYLPDGGVHWRALRENNYSYVDMATLSPPLADLIMRCMQADPALRPTIDQVVAHPIMQRVIATGGPALAPEDDSWLQDILASAGMPLSPPLAVAPVAAVDSEGDIVMAEA